MMSENLYWAKWKENVKRRAWTFVLCFGVMFLKIPALALISLNSMQSALERAAAYGAAEWQSAWDSMRTSFARNIGFSTDFILVAAVIAVLFAVQGFSFLYDRRKMDLYMSVPVSSSKRFWLIWGNGIVVFAACYLINLLLAWCAGAAFGVLDMGMTADSLLAYLVNLLAFIAVYQIALLAVMLTGNVLTALLGCGVLFFYEYALRLLWTGLKSTFYVSYCNADYSRTMDRHWLTPLAGYSNFCMNISYQKGAIVGYSGASGWCQSLLTEILLLLAAAFAVGALVYWMFRRRKTESYNQAIAFPAMKGVLEIVLLIPFGAGVGVVVSRSAQNENFFLFAGAVAAVLAGHAVIQLIYERELKAVIRRRGQALFCVALSCLILCVFRFDLTGFDSYVPERDSVESVSVTLEYDYSNFGREILSGVYKPAKDALLEGMNSREEDTIDAVLAMAEAWQQAGRYDLNGGDSEYIGADGKTVALEDAGCWVVRYGLKSGRSVYRRFFADSGALADELDVVLQDPSYQSLRYQIYSEEFEEKLEKMRLYYDDGKQEFLYTMDAGTLLDIYREEFKTYNYSMLSENLPCGRLIFRLPQEGANYTREWTYPVYAGFTETIAQLSENGIEAGERESVIPAEDVEEIRITFYVSEGEGGGSPLFEDGEVPEQKITCVFDTPEEIEQIVKALYPAQLAGVAGQEFKLLDEDHWFLVSVSLTAEAERKRYEVPDLFFPGGTTPDFVIQKIREAAVRE